MKLPFLRKVEDSLWLMGQALPRLESKARSEPDWIQANPRFIERASAHAESKEGGGWVVLDASRRITDTPRRFDVAGQEWVAWRAGGVLRVAPNTCPHMGARLSEGHCQGDKIVCPWHGLALGDSRGEWHTRPVHDDGVLVWARLLQDEAPTDLPIAAPRAPHVLEGTIRQEAQCDPEDIVANRLDPWHGAHYHPHSFARLVVTDVSEDAIALRVAYRAFGSLAVEVDCTFHAPTRRSIVMTITGGEGVGSVVETHATPIHPGRCAVVETTLACSQRPFAQHASKVSRLVRPFIERRAGRLWIEDIAYAERCYEIRRGASPKRGLQLVSE